MKAKLKELVRAQLKALAPKHFVVQEGASAKGYTAIQLEDDREIAVNPLLYPTLAALLDDLFVAYLRNTYQPYAYAQDWLLVSGKWPHEVRSVVASWDILMRSDRQMPVRSQNPEWARNSPKAFGLIPNTNWSICKAEQYSIIGFVTNWPDLAEQLHRQALIDEPPSSVYKKVIFDGQIKPVAEVDLSLYSYRFLLAVSRKRLPQELVSGVCCA